MGVWLPVTALAVLIGLTEGVLFYTDLSWQMKVVVHGLLLGEIAAGA